MNCENCIHQKVCKYNDGHNLWCKGDCPEFNKGKRGYWIYMKKIEPIRLCVYKCSACDNISGEMTNFCQHCGAEMTKEKE